MEGWMMKNMYVYPFCIMLLVTSVFAHNNNYHENKIYPIHAKVNDTFIDSEINARLKANPLLYNANVTTSSKDGIVYISGLVEYDIEAENIVTTACTIRGVKDVDVTCLEIEKSKTPSHTMLKNDYIAAKIKGALIKENLLNDPGWCGIKIETVNGVVYLTGCVKDPILVDKIIEITKLVKGVVKVVSNIKIGQ
jgi:hyperosmotically inducible periplasmic protein